MRIGEADVVRVERVRLDHVPHFVEPRQAHSTQRVHFGEDFWAVAQRSESNLCDDKGVYGDLARQKKISHLLVASPEMVYPDGCVGENHYATRVRLMGSRSGSVPPTAANLREASM